MSEPTKIGLLTAREYQWLKTSEVIEPHEQLKLEEFEKAKAKKYADYLKGKPAKELKEKIMITKGLLWSSFKPFYHKETGQVFIENEDSLKNIAVVINYLAFDDDFFVSDRLTSKHNEPSFERGLLITGKFGNGKTSIMKALSKMTTHFLMPIRFKFVNAHDIVTEWETLESPGEKSLFFERYLCKCLCIDDVKKEKKASNYGITEIIKEILEKRYDKKLKTFITCNFREGDKTGDLNDSLEEFNRYGDHIYDRIFEMFNIIEFKGKSFRI